jgi:hypothetical protein
MPTSTQRGFGMSGRTEVRPYVCRKDAERPYAGSSFAKLAISFLVPTEAKRTVTL